MHKTRTLAVLLLLPLVIVAGPPAGADSHIETAAIADAWLWPTPEPHRVTRGFVAPASQYAAGHRGIDLASRPGDMVLAPHDGVVSFAGRVVDRMVLSISEDGDLITSLEPVEAIVVVGDRVRAGQAIGVVSTGGHCAPGCLHLGVRLHGHYVSPMLYLGVIPRAVLLPAGPPS